MKARQFTTDLCGTWLWAPATRNLDSYFLERYGTEAFAVAPTDMGLPEPVGAAGVWREMDLPGNWHSRGAEDCAGAVWFARRLPPGWQTEPGRLLLPTPLTAPPEPGGERRVWLRFEGVDYFAMAWVNGRLVGAHEGYFQPFEFDITQALVPPDEDSEGLDDLLLVLVSSPIEPPGTRWPNHKRLIKGIFGHHDCRPGGWDLEKGQSKNTGGIWGRVELVVRGPVWVGRCHVDPVLVEGGAARLAVRTRVHSALDCALEVVLRTQVYNPEPAGGTSGAREDRLVLQPGGQDLTTVLPVRDPKLWWPWDHGEQPLYKLGLSMLDRAGNELCSHAETFGIREFRMDADRTCYVNGRRVFLRGTNIIPTQWLGDYTASQAAQDVGLLKAAGFNAVRVHAHVNRREFYEACDNAGILVWQDAPLQWSYDESDAVYGAAARQVEDMVSVLFNHPSVAVWCCHNEPSTNRRSLDPVLHRVARQMDGSRPVFEASDFHEHPYPGWYYGDYHEFAALPGAPLPTEFGAQGLPDRETMEAMMPPEKLWPPDWAVWAYHNFQHDNTFNAAGVKMGASLDEFIRNSQDYQAALVKFGVETYRRAKYDRTKGFFQFMFVDCWPAITWAVVDHLRRPKKAYHALSLGCQPLLVSVDLRRRVLATGRALEGAVWVINDFPRAFERVQVDLTLENVGGPAPNPGSAPVHGGGRGGRLEVARWSNLAIPADSCQAITVGWEGRLAWRIPRDLAPGKYRLCAVLSDERGAVLSSNYEDLEVTPAPDQ